MCKISLARNDDNANAPVKINISISEDNVTYSDFGDCDFDNELDGFQSYSFSELQRSDRYIKINTLEKGLGGENFTIIGEVNVGIKN
ncbi:hypothetical protein JF259_16065 [Snuella sp. CAU 1569]|uniref:Uncharacterized protein n=2 Tax=Snuella sedimenti TaxID=2798802 RepID=A0A8J7IIG2_9FLAO|nr:hypothetical protein [Snuella sedimenti]